MTPCSHCADTARWRVTEDPPPEIAGTWHSELLDRPVCSDHLVEVIVALGSARVRPAEMML